MFTNVNVGVHGYPGGRDAIALAARLAEQAGQMTFAHVYAGEAHARRGSKTAAEWENPIGVG